MRNIFFWNGRSDEVEIGLDRKVARVTGADEELVKPLHSSSPNQEQIMNVRFER